MRAYERLEPVATGSGEPGCPQVALLPGEPSGKIITRTAGKIEVWAALSWRSAEEVPPNSLLPVFPENVKPLLTDTPGAKGAARLVAGELCALHDEGLTTALDLFLRTLTEKAALTDAVLEIWTARQASPQVAQNFLVCEMARELWEAGFRVTFGTSWEPAPGADLTVGADSVLRDYIQESGSWKMIPRCL